MSLLQRKTKSRNTAVNMIEKAYKNVNKEDFIATIEVIEKQFENLSSLNSETSKFEWTLDNIRIEKIISVPIWATNIFLDVRYCPKLKFCAISRKTNDAPQRKWQEP